MAKLVVRNFGDLGHTGVRSRFFQRKVARSVEVYDPLQAGEVLELRRRKLSHQYS